MKTKFILLTAFIFIFTAFANAQSALVGEWEIVSITDAKVGNVDLDAGQNMVTFEKKRFYGSICNNFGGNYSVAKNKLKFSQVRVTMMYCKDVKTEGLVTSVFEKQATFSLKNNVLTLTDAKKQITLQLERVKKQKASLINSWQLNSFESDKKVFSWIGEVFLNIEKNKIGGNGGFNSYGGNVAMTGNTVKVSNIFSTKMFCEGSIENQYFEALGKVTSFFFEFKNSQLILTDKTKRIVLIFDQVMN